MKSVIVFTESTGHQSLQKWDRFKGYFSVLRLVSSGEEAIGYMNTTNRKGIWKIELRHEVLVRDPVGAAVSPTRPTAQQGARTRAPSQRRPVRQQPPGAEDEEIQF
jgi:hypothetical protein